MKEHFVQHQGLQLRQVRWDRQVRYQDVGHTNDEEDS